MWTRVIDMRASVSLALLLSVSACLTCGDAIQSHINSKHGSDEYGDSEVPISVDGKARAIWHEEYSKNEYHSSHKD